MMISEQQGYEERLRQSERADDRDRGKNRQRDATRVPRQADRRDHDVAVAADKAGRGTSTAAMRSGVAIGSIRHLRSLSDRVAHVTAANRTRKSFPNLPGPGHISPYFKRMSFLTDLTPPTSRATCIAVTSFEVELTNPLN